MTEKNNIFESQEMRRMPYEVPSGYFESLQERLAAIPAQHPLEQTAGKVVKITFWQRVSPYVALAACFIMAVVLGNFFLSRQPAVMEDVSLQEYQQYLYSDLMPVTNPYAMFDDSYVEDDSPSEDDIVNYLISSGVSSDMIAYALFN